MPASAPLRQSAQQDSPAQQVNAAQETALSDGARARQAEQCQARQYEDDAAQRQRNAQPEPMQPAAASQPQQASAPEGDKWAIASPHGDKTPEPQEPLVIERQQAHTDAPPAEECETPSLRDQLLQRAAEEEEEALMQQVQMQTAPQTAPEPQAQSARAVPEPQPMHADVIDAKQGEGAPACVGELPQLGGPYGPYWQWRSVQTPGQGLSYLLGEARVEGEIQAVAVAVPGMFAPVPPAHLQGFQLFTNGYWVLAQDAKTGELTPVED